MATLTMPEAFLQDVIGHKGDDAPRLIYADWLEERGEQARAEFIRVQCEAEKWRTICAAHDPARQKCPGCALRRRERELLGAHWGSWLPRLRALWQLAGDVDPNGSIAIVIDPPDHGRAAAFTVTFRRGFPAEITCRLGDWCGGRCEQCLGRGRLDARDWHRPRECPECGGTGRTPGHGPALVRAAPLSRVTLSDRQPWDRHISERWWWVAEGTSPFTGYQVPESCFLPADLMRYLPSEGLPRGYGLTAWRTPGGRGSRQAAIDAASAALLAWATS